MLDFYLEFFIIESRLSVTIFPLYLHRPSFAIVCCDSFFVIFTHSSSRYFYMICSGRTCILNIVNIYAILSLSPVPSPSHSHTYKHTLIGTMYRKGKDVRG